MTTLQGEAGGRYRLGELQAAGGQGAVYRAVDEADGRVVAVKVLHAPGAAGDAARLAGLRLVALGEDPTVGRHLVPAWDGGWWGDRWFLVMAYQEHTLEDHLAAGGDPEAVARALVNALVDLEAAGEVHGDLKPSNVFVQADGDDCAVLLADLWGGRGGVPLSPGAAAPELWAGAAPSRASDRYALGATLWAIFTGGLPAVAVGGPARRAPTRAEAMAAGVPDPWVGPVGALLAVAPEQRPAPGTRAVGRDRPAPRWWALLGAGLALAGVAAVPVLGTPAPEVSCPEGFSPDPAGRCAAGDGRVVVWLPPGRLVMGEVDAASRALVPDAPARPTTLTRGFWMRTTEVRQAEARALLGRDLVAEGHERLPDDSVVSCATWEGHTTVGDDLPLACVSWFEAVALANAASVADGLRPAYRVTPGEPPVVSWDREAEGWRLPTEAEWEWAATGGGGAARWTGAPARDEVCGWGNVRDQGAPEHWGNEVACDDGAPVLAPVASYRPGPLGMYDLIGNVGEWVWDRYGVRDPAPAVDPVGPVAGPLRMFRGGGWNQIARPVVARYGGPPDEGGLNVGVRLVRW